MNFEKLLKQLIDWCGVNTATGKHANVSQIASEIGVKLQRLGASWEEVDLGNGFRAWQAIQRPKAAQKILLVGHLDTVPHPTFAAPEQISAEKLRGIGAIDMKGGVVAMMAALEAFEKKERQLGWEVLLTEDEEIGSPYSKPLLQERAAANQWGLVFEPSLERHVLAGRRSGSANIRLDFTGKSAHAGRDFAAGVSAIHPLVRALLSLEQLSDIQRNITVNIGRVVGGSSLNQVPAEASAWVNVRAPTEKSLNDTLAVIAWCVEQEGGVCRLLTKRPPKEKDAALCAKWEAAAAQLGIAIQFRDTGGVCDGNTLAAAGLPTLDSVGVAGYGMHTLDETLEINSLAECAAITVNFLEGLEADVSG